MRTRPESGLATALICCALIMASSSWALTRDDVLIFCATQEYVYLESGQDSATAYQNVWHEGYAYNNYDPACSKHSDYGWELPPGSPFYWTGMPFKYGGCNHTGDIQSEICNGKGIGSHHCHWENHGCGGLDCPDYSLGMQCSALWSHAIGEGCLSTSEVVDKAVQIQYSELAKGDALIRPWVGDTPGHTIVFSHWVEYPDWFWGYEVSAIYGARSWEFYLGNLFDEGFIPWCAKTLMDEPGSRIEDFVLVSEGADLIFHLKTIVERNAESYHIIWSVDGQEPWMPVTESQSSAGDQTTGAEYTLTVDGRFSGYFQIEETEEGGRPIAYDMIFVP